MDLNFFYIVKFQYNRHNFWLQTPNKLFKGYWKENWTLIKLIQGLLEREFRTLQLFSSCIFFNSISIIVKIGIEVDVVFLPLTNIILLNSNLCYDSFSTIEFIHELQSSFLVPTKRKSIYTNICIGKIIFFSTPHVP